MSDWISVQDKLPPEAEDVLCYIERNAYKGEGNCRVKDIAIGWQIDGHWHADGYSKVTCSHWMELPDVPEGE